MGIRLSGQVLTWDSSKNIHFSDAPQDIDGDYNFTGAVTGIVASTAPPGGSNTQIQFNNSGAFGGSASLTWNNSLGFRMSLATDSKNIFNIGSSITDFSVAMQNGFVFQTGPTNFLYHGTETNVPSAVQIALETTVSGDYGLTVLSFTTGSGTPIGLNIDAGNSGAANIDNSQGIAAAVAVLSTGNLIDAQVYSAQAGFHNSSGRIINYIGFDTQDFSEGTGTNIAFRSQQSAGVGSFAFYAAGTAASHFGGPVDVTGGITTTAVAVASLPSSPVEGMRAAVNNSNAASFTLGIGAVVAGGGTTRVPVYYDGTNWRIG